MEKPSAFSRRALLKAAARSSSRSGCRSALDTLLAINAAHAQGAKPPLHAERARLLHRDQCRRHGLGLLRQDGHGPGPVRRDRPDGGGGARRAVQGRHGVHGRHRDQREPGRRVGLDRHPARRQADAHGGGRSAPRAHRDGGREARHAGRRAHRRRRRRAAPRATPRKKVAYARADRRALLQRPARLEQAVGQSALRARQGAAEEARPSTRSSASRSSARTWRRKCSAPGGLLHRHEGARHAAWPRDPPAGRWRGAGQVDESSIKDIPGVKVVREKDFLGLVAETGMGRDQGRREAEGRVVERRAGLPRDRRHLRPHPQGAGAQARRGQADRQRRRSVRARRRASSRPNTNGRSSRMPAWDRPARWSRSRTGRRPAGPARRNRISCATASP